MQAAPLARWRWAGCGSPPALRASGGGTSLAVLLPLALLLFLGLPQGRPAAQAPSRALLLPPRRPPLEAAAALEALEAAEEAEALEELEAEALEAEGAGLALAAAKRQQHQFDDYGHMRFGKRSEGAAATAPSQQQQRTVFRHRPPTQMLRVRKFDDYGHMRFGRSEK